MGSLIPILMLVIWLVLRAVAANKQKKEKEALAQRRMMAPGRPQTVAQPQNPFEEWIKSLNPQPEVIDEIEVEEDAVDAVEEAPAKKPVYKSSLEMQARPTIESPIEDEESSEIQNPKKPASEKEPANAGAPKFDIKQAIIYSEILRRKFEVE